jgi:hypothetical protein
MSPDPWEDFDEQSHPVSERCTHFGPACGVRSNHGAAEPSRWPVADTGSSFRSVGEVAMTNTEGSLVGQGEAGNASTGELIDWGLCDPVEDPLVARDFGTEELRFDWGSADGDGSVFTGALPVVSPQLQSSSVAAGSAAGTVVGHRPEHGSRKRVAVALAMSAVAVAGGFFVTDRLARSTPVRADMVSVVQPSLAISTTAPSTTLDTSTTESTVETTSTTQRIVATTRTTIRISGSVVGVDAAVDTPPETAPPATSPPVTAPPETTPPETTPPVTETSPPVTQ